MNSIYIAIGLQVIATVALIIWVKNKVKLFFKGDAEIEKVRREIISLITELNATADRNIGILEAKISELRSLIADGDIRIQLMNKEKTIKQKETSIYDNLGRVIQPKEPKVVAEDRLMADTIQKITTDQPIIRFSNNPVKIEAPFVEQVLSLYKKGFSSDIIASKLKSTIAEVDLVITLESERNKSNSKEV